MTFVVVSHNQQATFAPFSRDRLFVSVLRACANLPNQTEIAAELTANIASQIIAKSSSGKISTHDIGETTAQILNNYNPSVFLNYAAQHQHIVDVSDLTRKLR